MVEKKDQVLYLAVLPLVHILPNHVFGYGLTDEVLTLLDRANAAEFLPEEVDNFIRAFEWRANKYLVGGEVKGYTLEKVVGPNGRVVVKVTQKVE